MKYFQIMKSQKVWLEIRKLYLMKAYSIVTCTA